MSPVTKEALRQRVRARLAELSPPQRSEAAKAAAKLLQEQTAWQTARSVLFYAPLPDEVDLWPLLEHAVSAGRTVALPCFHAQSKQYVVRVVVDCGRDLISGRFGVREPGEHCELFDLNRLDLLLVPGVAFDPDGRRLGRGRGHYDRLLAGVTGVCCGVAFDEQVIERVPAEPHDAQLNCILTPSRWILPQRAVLE